VTTVARLWFHVPFTGSTPLFLGASLLYLLSALGLGLFVSTVSTTQREAFMTTFLIFMPIILLSGFMFPVSSMPTVFRWLAEINPMTHFLVIVRGVFLKGAGLGTLWPRLVVLGLMGIVIFSLVSMRFRKI
jgi:ABC-2 type transport system permease protein